MSSMLYCFSLVAEGDHRAASAVKDPGGARGARTTGYNLTPHTPAALDYIFVFNNSVTFLYDSTTKPVGSSAYIHSAGQNDELCTSIVGKEKSDEPCTLLATSDGWRRVLFPRSGQCCKFCNTTQECGIVRPDWLQDNATYQGRKEVAGMTCDGWMKRGGEENYWWAQVDTQQPALYYEGYPTLPQSSNYWRFIPSLFSRAPLPADAFAIPPGCDAMCDIAGSSYRERIAARWAAGVGGISKQAPPPAA